MCVGLIQTTAQLANNDTAYSKLLFQISIAAFVVNLVLAALWAFYLRGATEDNWKIRFFKAVFYSTGALSPYAAISVLFPKKLTWYLLAAICVIITLFKCCNMLKTYLTSAYQKVVDVTRWIPLLNMTRNVQDAAPTPAPALPPLDA